MTNHNAEPENTQFDRHDLMTIVDVCKLMNSAMHYDPLIEQIMDFSTRVMNVEGASVLLHDETINKLIFHFSTGECSQSLKKIVLNTDEGIAGWVYQNSTPVLSNDLSNDERFCSRVDTSVDFVTRSILAVPLTLENHTIGVFELVNRKDPQGFVRRDLLLAEGIAAQVALALERVRLIHENMTVNRLATIGETVAGLAHYIKNILTGLEGTRHLIGIALRDNDHGRIQKMWPVLENSINKISTLTLDMLEFSKDRKPDYTCKNINDIIAEAMELCDKKADSLGIALHSRLDPAMMPAYFDCTGIFRCLLNMLTNSIDACKDTENPVITVSSHFDRENLTVKVADNGCGMSPEIIEKIMMSKFFSTKGSKGTGLGVPVIRKIISEHAGSLDIASRQGEGSEITFKIPALFQLPEQID
ncbi:MAG: ATP-binding protein [Candidatus Auribacterota bacterium]|jgi:signal transduction histidine kinase|nr:ATP-binding protein [Candidatus Auribacterota bacterium]